MGCFKKLTGADVRVTPIQVKTSKTNIGRTFQGTNSIVDIEGGTSNSPDFTPAQGIGVSNEAQLYNSVRQLFYGAFIDQDFLLNGSIFSNFYDGTEYTNHPEGAFSRFDPSFQGSLAYQRTLPLGYGDNISVLSVSTRETGESIVPGTIVGTGFTDDTTGNLINNSGEIIGNVFYDQGILVASGSSAISAINCDVSYTVYATQYKCTASPNEFNYSLNPTLLSGSNSQYNPIVVT